VSPHPVLCSCPAVHAQPRVPADGSPAHSPRVLHPLRPSRGPALPRVLPDVGGRVGRQRHDRCGAPQVQGLPNGHHRQVASGTRGLPADPARVRLLFRHAVLARRGLPGALPHLVCVPARARVRERAHRGAAAQPGDADAAHDRSGPQLYRCPFFPFVVCFFTNPIFFF